MESITSGAWGWVPFVGGLVLLAVIGWAMLKNRKHSSPREIERTEQATKAAREAGARDNED